MNHPRLFPPACFLALISFASISGCDEQTREPEILRDEAGDLDIGFRECDRRLSVCDGLKNTSMLGDSELGLRHLLLDSRLASSDDNDVVALEIHGHQCFDDEDEVMDIDVFVDDPILTIEGDGTLGPVVVHASSDPALSCTIRDELWIGTEWAVERQGDVEATIGRLRIADLTWTPGKSAVYHWETDHTMLYGSGGWQPTCSEDVSDNETVFYGGLRVDESTGEFDHDANAVYMGCMRGMVVKSGYTWGYEMEPFDVRQVVANAGIAKYCGPSSVAYTREGNLLTIWNKTGSGPHQFEPGVGTVEAVWDASMHALCIGTPRDALISAEHVTGTPFECEDGTMIPACTSALMATYETDPDVMFITYAVE